VTSWAEALDDEDAILDLRAQSAHFRAVRLGPETKKYHTDHRQPGANSIYDLKLPKFSKINLGCKRLSKVLETE